MYAISYNSQCSLLDGGKSLSDLLKELFNEVVKSNDINLKDLTNLQVKFVKSDDGTEAFLFLTAYTSLTIINSEDDLKKEGWSNG